MATEEFRRGMEHVSEIMMAHAATIRNPKTWKTWAQDQIDAAGKLTQDKEILKMVSDLCESIRGWQERDANWVATAQAYHEICLDLYKERDELLGRLGITKDAWLDEMIKKL